MRKIFSALIAFALLLVFSTTGWSTDFQKGVAAYKRGDFATALGEWEPLAEQGIASAQYNLGVMYHKGNGVPQNYKNAVKWFRLAAKQGKASAQYNLGIMYLNGNGVPQDDKTAVKWFRPAAKQGDANAKYLLKELLQKNVYIDTLYYYRLRTEFTGPGMCLDVINGGKRNNTTRLVTCADNLGQYWRFIPADQGFYRLTTWLRGAQMCLSDYNGVTVKLDPCADNRGQLWQMNQDRKSYRLTTSLRGPKNCLDIHNGGSYDGSPHLISCAKYSGQLWSFQRTTKTVR